MLYLMLVKVFHTKTSSSKTKKIFFFLGWGKFYHYYEGAFAKTITTPSSKSLQIANSHYQSHNTIFPSRFESNVHLLVINQSA